jgi:hypothetical protein
MAAKTRRRLGPAGAPLVDIATITRTLRALPSPGAPVPPATRPDQVVGEEILGVGARSGRIHFIAGERGPENIVIGDGRGGSPVRGAPGVRAYATGGTIRADVEAALGHPLTPEQEAIFQANIGNVQMPTGTPQVRPPAFAGSGGIAPGAAAPAASVPPTQTQRQQYQAAQGVLNATQAQIAAQQAALAASAGTSAATGSYLTAQEQAAQQQLRDQQAIINARNNVTDQVNVARARNDQAALEYKYALAGLPVPQDVTLPEGYRGPLPPGVRPALLTQEQRLTQEAQDRAALASGQVEQARIAAARAGLSEDAASRAVTAAGIGVAQARLDQARAETPPAPGLVYDEFGGNWVTPQQLQTLNAQRGLVQDPSDPTGATWVTRLDLASRTDLQGNVRNATTGILTDPQTGNQFIDGAWTDPRTGNRFVGGHWVSPEGNVFIDGYWWTPDLKFRLQGGLWVNPVTGDRIINGEFVPGGGAGGSLDLSSLFGP